MESIWIDNAGVMNIPCELTKDGYETQCQTVSTVKVHNDDYSDRIRQNFLSPILLTQSLLPWMDTKSGRVLFASSSTLYAINDLNTTFSACTYGWDGLNHYAYSKACIAHMAARLAKSTRVKIYGNIVATKCSWHESNVNWYSVSPWHRSHKTICSHYRIQSSICFKTV